MIYRTTERSVRIYCSKKLCQNALQLNGFHKKQIIQGSLQLAVTSSQAILRINESRSTSFGVVSSIPDYSNPHPCIDNFTQTLWHDSGARAIHYTFRRWKDLERKTNLRLTFLIEDLFIMLPTRNRKRFENRQERSPGSAPLHCVLLRAHYQYPPAYS